MLTDTSEITLVTEAKVAAKHWTPASENGAPRNAPLLLVSDESENSQWSRFADDASGSGDVYAVWDVSPYTLVQTIWAIGEPASVVAHGKNAGDIALLAAKMAKGAVRALALVDYGLDEGDSPPFDNTICPLVLIRGRQSEIADHQQVVSARSALGAKCKLVELENCGNRAAEACPQDFAATVDWFLRAESD
ncbi:MAG: alpha/beta hydrolase [Chloroflexi bacterium]|nr:alpha/beta hydrolase [Chloroflexota bacterium]MYK62499.1 alpha/beta hydrolase [Chloroflexota bacterium]